MVACSRFIGGSPPWTGIVSAGVTRGALAKGWISGPRYMSMLHGKQTADAGNAAIAIATAKIISPTRIVLQRGRITASENLPALFLYDNHPDHTRLLVRKAKVAIGARHCERVAVVAAGRDEAGVERHRTLWHRGVHGVLRIGGAGRDGMHCRAIVNTSNGIADLYRDFLGRIERPLVSHLDHDGIAGRLGRIG